jgi:DNA polymerase-1
LNGYEAFLHRLALGPDQQTLVVSSELDEMACAIVSESRPAVVGYLRRTQMSAAGFYTCLPGTLEREIRAAKSLTLAVETTAPTRFSRPTRIHKQTLIGSESWPVYRAKHSGVRADSKPRVRALTIDLYGLGACSFDLDALLSEERDRLLERLLQQKVIIGHDLGSALGWLFVETCARPTLILDTRLLIQHVRPGALLRPFRQAASADQQVRERSADLIRKFHGRPSGAAEYVGRCFELASPDWKFAHRESWCVSELSEAHRLHSEARTEFAKEILTRVTGSTEVSEVVRLIDDEAPWYRTYSIATIRLAEAHVRGVPFDMEAAAQLKHATLPNTCDEAVEAYAVSTIEGKSERSEVAPTVSSGDHGQNALAGVHDVPCGGTPAVRHDLAMLGRYQAAAKCDGRLHSVVSFSALTGRTTSIEPPLQNLPRDPNWRRLIRAKAGHCILSVDYAAIEMRIAAALAARAVNDIRYRLKSTLDEDWFIRLIRAGIRSESAFVWPEETSRPDLDWYARAIPAVAQRVVGGYAQVMKSAFQSGVDPHLVTAVDLGRRTRILAFAGEPLDYLAKMDANARAELKLQLAEQRRAAKSCNFGLLYGMNSDQLYQHGVNQYGLTWTPRDAASARGAWFQLYPEMLMWHLWTRFCQGTKRRSDFALVWNRNHQQLQQSAHDIRVYRLSTLAGRRFCILDDHRQALNYQSQGTGADILAKAIALLPEEIAAMLLIPVHDELVFEVPEDKVWRVRAVVEASMITAGEGVIGEEIPIEVESHLGDYWQS